jgi:hypothetical protein
LSGADKDILQDIPPDRQREWGEAKYDMAGNTQTHKWAPKLVFHLFNMAMNNAYIMFKVLLLRGWESVVYREGGEGAGTWFVPMRTVNVII